MDERLEKAVEFSNYMVTLDNQKRILKEQYYESLIYYFNKGQFTISQELISFLQSLNSMNQTEAILIDDNELPIHIEDLKLFIIEVTHKFFAAGNKYLNEYNKLAESRSVKGLINL
jgi:hypothetical protein